MYSPTGYYAHYAIHTGDTETHQFLPVLHWNDDGYPVIANPGGHLQTVGSYGRTLEGNLNLGDDGYLNWTVVPYSSI